MAKMKQRQGLRGAVLIMVLTVMVVLIIMLMATLTVVTTAGQRVYTKYEENQAYYTARSALDVFALNVLDDNDYYAYDSSGKREYKYTSVDPTTGAQVILTADMKQGRAMESEIYKVKSQGIDTAQVAAKHDSSFANLDGTPKADAYEALGFAENMYESDNIFGSVSGTSAPENEFYGVSTDKLNNDDDSSKQFDYIEYKIAFPKVSSSSDTYGRLVDEDSGEQIAKIKIEVLNRKYATSPEYTKEQIIDVIKSTDTADDDALKAAIKAGDRSQDKYTLKITSTVEFMDTEGTAVLIFDSTERPVVNSTRAITTVNDINEGSGIIPIGGASSLSDAVFTTDDNTAIAGDIFLKGSFLNGSNVNCMLMFEETLHVVLGDVTFNNVYPDFVKKGSVLYSNGTVNLNLNSSYGTSSAVTNIVASTVKFNDNGKQMPYYGNIFSDVVYLEKADAAQAPTINGQIYTNYLDVRDYTNVFYPGSTDSIMFSNVDTSNINTLSGKVILAKGFIVNVDDGTGTGNVVSEKFDWDHINNTLTRVSTGDVINLDTTSGVVPPVTYNAASEVKIGYYNKNHYKYDESTCMKTFTLPAKLAGRSVSALDVPTVKALYREIFKETAFVNDDTGDNEGKIGDLAIGEMPVFDVSGITLPYNDDEGHHVITLSGAFLEKALKDDLTSKNPWELDPFLDQYIAEGIITSTDKDTIKNKWDDKTVQYWPEVIVHPGIKNAIITTVETAKAADTDYQDELNKYYANYISGAEKAEEADGSLLKFKDASSAINVKNLSDVTVATPGDFKAGGNYAKLSSAKGIIDTSGYLVPGTNYGTESNPVIIDARNSDIIIQLGTGTNSTAKFIGYFIVVGDKTVKVYLPDGSDYELGETNSSNPFHIATYELEYAADLGLGTINTSEPPNVYIYAGNKVRNVKINSPGKYRLLTAYIYCPFAYFNMSGAADAGATYFSPVKYNGYTIPMGGNGFSVIGSLIANKYTSSNNTGVGYICPEGDSTDEGDPLLAWKPSQYVRK